MQARLIIGLGNPGNEYIGTRHNIGFLAVDRLAQQNNIKIQKKGLSSFYGNGSAYGCKVIIAKPQTYMNRSGVAVHALADYYAIATEDIIVVHDDLDIPFGQLKIKTQGGSAGHRGVASLQQYLRGNNFLRIRVGIGKPEGNIDPSAFVLQKFSLAEQKLLADVITTIISCIESIFLQGPEAAMNKFHGSSP